MQFRFELSGVAQFCEQVGRRRVSETRHGLSKVQLSPITSSSRILDPRIANPTLLVPTTGYGVRLYRMNVCYGTSATFTRRGAMSELNLEADISRRLAPQAASAPWASDEIASQCLATNFVAWSLTSAKSPPTRVRHRARSGSPLQLAGDPRYRLILPAKRTNAQSAFAVLQADNLNTAAIRSGPSCSSWIALSFQSPIGRITAAPTSSEETRKVPRSRGSNPVRLA